MIFLTRGVVIMALVYQKFERPTSAQNDLLLSADPSQSLIDSYLKTGTAFAASDSRGLIGVLVLLPRANQILEIANLAVTPSRQRQGYGKALLEFARQWASDHGYHMLRVATGTTSFTQLYLYQRQGYRVVAVEADYFTTHYNHDIMENGLKLRDRLVLTRRVVSPTD